MCIRTVCQHTVFQLIFNCCSKIEDLYELSLVQYLCGNHNKHTVTQNTRIEPQNMRHAHTVPESSQRCVCPLPLSACPRSAQGGLGSLSLSPPICTSERRRIASACSGTVPDSSRCLVGGKSGRIFIELRSLRRESVYQLCSP